ncbi:polysaccharide deacetylase family protein [Bacillus timonensis]|nr:polysaccharide deacetylase family protein [Bacillus timonensis]
MRRAFVFISVIILIILFIFTFNKVEILDKKQSAVMAFHKKTSSKNFTLKAVDGFYKTHEGDSSIDSRIEEVMQTTFRQPTEWGLHVTGVKNRLRTDEKVVALSFDACGGGNGVGYDEELIQYLVKEQIPATLFFNRRWIEANKETFLMLAKNPLFEVENHGTHHKPLSVTGNTAYGIEGTKSVEEVIEEVMDNHHFITKLTGKSPKYFRSGTAHYDEVAIEVINKLGLEAVNFDINGDAGATFNQQQVQDSILQSKPGSIVIMHMNRPEHDTAEGVKLAVPILKERGFTFVKLSDYDLE